MMSVYSVLFTLVLFSELRGRLLTVAMPATKAEVGVAEQDGLGLLLRGEATTEHAVAPPVYRQSSVLDNIVRDEDGIPQLIIFSEMRLKGHRVRGLDPASNRILPLLTDQSLSHTPEANTLKIGRRNTDLNMLQCMIGRVYRPCWRI